jgi:general secretion pathway protein D
LDGGVLSANTFAFVGKSREILLKLNALRTKTKVRILEAPSILALDGMQASINVGSEIPYPAGSYTSSAGGSTTSVQYRETGVTLLVLPRISASGAVTLDITQEVSTPGAEVNVGNETALSFAKSLVTTSFYVQDGDTVAIAGLIHDKADSSRTGIPFLSEIPILGNLFGTSNKNTSRSELIILITPHVIRTHEKLQEMTQDLKDSLRNVRKFAQDKEEEMLDDLQEGRKDREKQQQKSMKKEKDLQPSK